MRTRFSGDPVTGRFYSTLDDTVAGTVSLFTIISAGSDMRSIYFYEGHAEDGEHFIGKIQAGIPQNPDVNYIDMRGRGIIAAFRPFGDTYTIVERNGNSIVGHPVDYFMQQYAKRQMDALQRPALTGGPV